MIEFIDNVANIVVDGVNINILLLDGPCILNTEVGEVCGSAGQYVVQVEGRKPSLVNKESLDKIFPG